MADYVDLTHEFRDGMPGFRLQNEDGSHTEFTAEIQPFLTHEQTRPKFDGRASFEITEMNFQTSIGTYLDAPGHRFPEARDISELDLSELIADGVVVNARERDPYEAVDETVLPCDVDLSGKAVLFEFGWDSHWGSDQYREYPYISESVIDRLVAADVSVVGVDTINIDDDRNPDRPAHTTLLKEDIFIVENLRGLKTLRNRQFRFHAIPIKAAEAVAMPVRAFAEMT
ncbi:cyclase family protein [Halococcus sp. PRR34]|uniref:cyclase family protein n=1 Tax=Halococcus sp. PRR34 TaxID=3020830 RepID=UPI00235EA9B4|nr:cyclase family protein [Halococcus sp. PRR34]